MTDGAEYQAMRRRLWNWGRWASLGSGAPDKSCANPMYDMMIEREDGWGDDPPANVVRTCAPGIEPPEIDEYDAEVLDCLIRQAPRPHRSLLVRVYVLRVGEGSRMDIDAAIRAIWDVVSDNRAAVDEARRHGL